MLNEGGSARAGAYGPEAVIVMDVGAKGSTGGAHSGDRDLTRVRRSGRVVRGGLAFLLVWCLLCAVPGAAWAGHVQSRFIGPDLPEPEWETFVSPQVSGANVAYQLHYPDDPAGAGVWAIGGGLPVAWDLFTYADHFDYSGSLVAYGSHNDIYVTDGVASYPVCVGTGAAISPRIDGLTVVWQDDRGGTWDIYAATLDPATYAVTAETAVCTAPGRQSKPDIGGDWVVWQDKRDGRFDIYGRRLSGGGVKALCLNSEAQDSPRTDGDWVVWTDWRNGGFSSDIYGRRFGSPVRPICHAAKKQYEPDVSSGFVVWTDYRSTRSRGGFERPVPTSIRGYETSSKDRFVVADALGMEARPDMDGLTVVWLRYSFEHRDQPWWGHIRGAVLQH
jgi:beta propeller repeat protein